MLVSCAPTNESAENNESKQNELQIEQTSFDDKERLSNNEVANHLAQIAVDVPHVNDAVAIVIGPYTVVGIDIDEDLTNQRVGTIKFSVSEAISHDPYGKNAVVIADGDIMQRLREMREQMRAGHPIQGITDELAEIVSRYMPTFPVEDSPDENTNRNEPIDEQDLDDHTER